MQTLPGWPQTEILLSPPLRLLGFLVHTTMLDHVIVFISFHFTSKYYIGELMYYIYNLHSMFYFISDDIHEYICLLQSCTLVDHKDTFLFAFVPLTIPSVEPVYIRYLSNAC
jgi:hypothetical protein